MINLKLLLPASGILVAILGITLIFTTVEGLVKLTGFIGIAMTLVGITALVTQRAKVVLLSGAACVLLGVGTVSLDGIYVITPRLILYIAVWIIFASLIRVYFAFNQRANGSPLWGFMFWFGALGFSLGMLTLVYWQTSFFVVAYSLAFMFISYGVGNIIVYCDKQN